MSKLASILLACAALTAARATAHEFWLQPSSFHAGPGERVGISVLVGQKFAGDTLPRIPDWFERFTVVAPDGEVAVGGEIGDDPAGAVTIGRPGYYIVVYQSMPESVGLSAEKFRSYLEEAGREEIIAERQARGLSQKSVWESYLRCAKTLIDAGPGPQPDTTRPIGLELEIVPLDDPRTARAGGEFRVRVLYRGEPLPDALVRAFWRPRPEAPMSARTDAAGVATLVLPSPGVWLLNVIHLVAGTDDTTDWFSYWGSLTWELR